MKFGNKRFVFVFLVPIAIFAISFIVTLLERVLIYMVVGFLLAWAVFFYSNRYFRKSQQDTVTELS